MGEVYKGLDTRVDRAVAIKVLPTDAVIDQEAGERFEREARALASLSHPRVCGLFEYTHFNDRAVLILDTSKGSRCPSGWREDACRCRKRCGSLRRSPMDSPPRIAPAWFIAI